MEGIVINYPKYTFFSKPPKSNLRKITKLLSIQLISIPIFREFNNPFQQAFVPGTVVSKMTHLEAATFS